MDRVAESLAGEWTLLNAGVRADTSALERLLHPDFAERGQSGRWCTRDATLDALPSEAGTYEQPEVRDVHADEIADGVVLVVYVSVQAGRRSERRLQSSEYGPVNARRASRGATR